MWTAETILTLGVTGTIHFGNRPCAVATMYWSPGVSPSTVHVTCTPSPKGPENQVTACFRSSRLTSSFRTTRGALERTGLSGLGHSGPKGP